MHIKILLKRAVVVCVAIIMLVTCTACFDLGDFEDEEEYYNSFGDIGFVYQNPNATEKDVLTKDYSVSDYFYNRNTGEDFTYGNPEDDEPDEGKDIPVLPYLYMVVPVEKDLTIDSLAFYFLANGAGSLRIEVYLLNELPDGGDFTNVKLFGDPERKEKLDDEGNPVLDENGNPVYEEIEYSDPDEQYLVAKGTAHVNSSEWKSFMIERWNGQEDVLVKDSQYLVLKFVNNGGYKQESDPILSFKSTNMLVRAFS